MLSITSPRMTAFAIRFLHLTVVTLLFSALT